jgi:hypothetical protein
VNSALTACQSAHGSGRMVGHSVRIAIGENLNEEAA